MSSSTSPGTPNDNNLTSNELTSDRLSQQFQGILYKRRDVMKRQWRPRLFVLNYELCVLSYYLLNDEYGSTNGSNDANFQNNASSFDYDVVPRGSINLRGCIVETRDDPRMEQNEKLFKFCITPMHSSSAGGDAIAYLAATSQQKREEWVQRIANLCCRTYSNQRQQNNFEETSSSPLMLRIPENQPRYEQDVYHDERSSSSISTSPSLTELESRVPKKSDKKHAKLEGIKETESPHNETLAETSSEGNNQYTNHVSSLSSNKTTNVKNNKDDSSQDDNENMNLYNNLPLDLAEKIDDIINIYLPMCDAGVSLNHNKTSQDTKNVSNIGEKKSLSSKGTVTEDEWQFLLENNGVLVHERPLPSEQYDETNPSNLFKSEAILPNHSPLEIFDLIIDITQISKYEPNIHTAHRLEQYNNFTFCDFFTYKASWPTQTRDFCLATHWRVLNNTETDNNENNDNSTIILVSFSWNRDDICPPQQNFVRGEYLVCLYTLQPYSPIQKNSLENSDDQRQIKLQTGCRFTRLLCANLGGTIHPSMSNAVMQQNAMVPTSINEYLTELKKNHKYQRFQNAPKITNAFILQNVIKPRKLLWKMNAKQIILEIETKKNYISNTTESSSDNADESLQTLKNDNLSLEQKNEEKKSDEQNTDTSNSIDKSERYYPLRTGKHNINEVDERLIVKAAIFLGLFLLGKISSSINPDFLKNENIFYYGWFMIVVRFIVLILFLASVKHSIDRLIHVPCKASESIQITASLAPLPSSSLLMVLTIPFLACEIVLLLTPLPFVRQISFFLFLWMISRALVRKSFGIQIKNTKLRTGPLICRFNVNVKGILRFIELKREENIEKSLFSKNKGCDGQPFIDHVEYRKPPMITEISVTHIVVKAIACAMAEVPALNSFNVSYPFLGIKNEIFTSCNGIAISVASNLHASSSKLVKNADTMSVEEIANELWMIQMNDARKERQKKDSISMFLHFMKLFSFYNNNHDTSEQGTALVITSPDSEHNEVDIDVIPSSQARDPNITILVGGIRVRRDDKGKARPLLSMSITINSPICNIGTCRKFVELSQKFIQFPELCETV